MDPAADLPPTIGAALSNVAAAHPTREALVDGDVRLTWSDLDAAVDRAAAAFVAAGIDHGDRIGIWAPNCAEWVIASLGAQRIGGVVVTMNTRFKGVEGAYNLRVSEARMLLTVTNFLDTDYLGLLRDLPDGMPESVEHVVVLRGHTPDGAVSWDDFLAGGDGVSAGDVADRSGAVGPDDGCDIIFTSGTTGDPKGALMGHGASIRVIDAWTSVVGLRAEDRHLIINPFFHSFGLKAGILACVLTGATILPHTVFDAPSVMAAIETERISMIPGPPAIYQTILNHPDLPNRDLSSLRLAVTGAAPVPVSLLAAMHETLGFETVITGYGLTESHGVVAMNRHDDPPELISRSDGRAIPGVEVITVDGKGQPTPPGEPGEVWVRGYNLMLGYIGNPEATAEAIDPDGWLHTGDIGVLDADGNLKITDRLKDMYICGGFNVYPAEVESLLSGHPDLAQVAVIGIPDDRLGEVGAAFVIPTAGTAPDPDEIIAWAREQMANYKVPRRVEVVDSLPMNASNKVRKFELRASIDT